MTGTLDRYILRNLVTGLSIGSAALVMLVWVISALRFLDWFVNKGLSVVTFLKLSFLLMPGFLTVFLPIALFAVVLFTYTKLSSDRELAVMQAAGTGPWRLSRPALVLCAFMMLIGYVLTMVIVPRLEYAFSDMQYAIRNEVSHLVLKEGRFNQVDDGVVVYVRERTHSGSLEGLLIHDVTNPEVSTTIMAERGALVSDEGRAKVLLLNGNRQELRTSDGRVSFLYFDFYTVDLGPDGADSDAFRYRDERQLPFDLLFSAEAGDQIHPDFEYVYEERNIRRFRMEGHLRILRPINHLGFLLLALAAVLTGEFSRRGGNYRVLLAVGMVVAIQAGILGASNLAKKSYDALYLLDVLHVLPILIGGLWLALPPERIRLHLRRRRERKRLGNGPPAPVSA